MEILSSTKIPTPSGASVIELVKGDLTALPKEHGADLLIVSAFPEDYTPTPRSLIGALHGRGVDMSALAHFKEMDRRPETNCWLSRPLDRPDLNIRRIVCFEPRTTVASSVADVVGDVFRMIAELEHLEPEGLRVCLPLLAAGDQREDRVKMLRAIVEASMRWFSIGLNVRRLTVTLHDSTPTTTVTELRSVFDDSVRQSQDWQPGTPAAHRYDYFISYSHADSEAADTLHGAIVSHQPDARIFIDRLELAPGFAWQEKIYEAIESSRCVIALLTPDYLVSKPCQEELSIALLRQREEGAGLLIPAYVKTASLPPRLRRVQYHDAREADFKRLESFAAHVCSRSDDTAQRADRSPAPRAVKHARQDLSTPIERSVSWIDEDLEIEVRVRRR